MGHVMIIDRKAKMVRLFINDNQDIIYKKYEDITAADRILDAMVTIKRESRPGVSRFFENLYSEIDDKAC